MLLYILLAVIIVSLISFVGIITFFWNKRFIDKIIFFLVSFACGALLAAAFFDLIPEAIEHSSVEYATGVILLGIVLFFILEKTFYWFHCHHGECAHHHKSIIKPFAYLNLVGDGLHNFIDGMVISGAFLTSYDVGIVASIAVILHEIPQEVGDFGILIFGGFKRSRALLFNFFSALMAIAGAVIAYFASTIIEGIEPFLLAFAAGNFIYLACTDLMPQLHHEKRFLQNFKYVFFLLLGVGLIWLVNNLLHH